MSETIPDLGGFQTAFIAALAGDQTARAKLGLGGERMDAGLSVYRNTIARGTIDALAASFPTVRRMVGEAWFEAAARIFIDRSPPTARALIHYGEGFAAFLDGFEPAADLPYLAGVARLDWLWLEAHIAADADALTPAKAAVLTPEALFETRLVLHPATRIAWFAAMNIPTLWIANRPPAPEPEPMTLDDRAEGLLLVRPGGAVDALIIDQTAWTLLDACARGLTLGQAAEAALDADPNADLPGLLMRLTSAGAFADPMPSPWMKP
jgi:hypothetical protein